ncbi:MAG: branched-chain amino acid aminotransferase [Chitinophagales bacterium]|nr:MAG: branched-chain amino acid aminotransferase [Chitinophagales bacterium]
MYFSNKSYVFLNGEFIKASDARITLFNQTLHYGNGVFEGIRAYGSPSGTTIFKAREHYKRLKESARKMHLKFDYSISELIDATYQLLKKNHLADAYIRPLLFSGVNMRLLPSEESNLFIGAWKWERYLGDKLVSVTISSYERPNPHSCIVDAKVTGHYTTSILATYEARKKGFDEALLLDMHGHVAEAPGSNFFYEKNGVLYTPPPGHILPGITRATVMEIAKELGIPVKEELFTPEQLHDADSAFFTGTAAEVAGIKSIDNRRFRKKWEDTAGYILSQKYKEYIRTGDYSHSGII